MQRCLIQRTHKGAASHPGDWVPAFPHSLLGLSYHDHLWLEKEIKSVANVTHRDIAEFLPIEAAAVQTYPLEEANRALLELKREPVQGAKVLLID